MTVLTLAEAEDLAARTLALLDGPPGLHIAPDLRDYLRARIASDLAGLRDHQPADYLDECGTCLYVLDEGPCPDARRYIDGLRRTADLYGVQS